MKKLLFILLSLLFSLMGWCQSDNHPVGIGHWRDHLSYGQINAISIGNHQVFGAANQGVIYYDLDDLSVVRLNKTNGLNDVGIQTIAFDATTEMLVVAYTNGNIDLVGTDKTYNVSGILRSNLSGSKRINSIRFHNKKAYLACDFGIVVINLNRQEIEDTYYLGNNGGYLMVNDIAFTDHLIIAATSEGLRYAPLTQQFLNIVSNWTVDTLSAVADMDVSHIETMGSNLWALVPGIGANDLFRLHASAASIESTELVPALSGDIRSMHVDQGKLILSFFSSVRVYDSNLILLDEVGDVSWLSMAALDAHLDKDGALWIGTMWDGMVCVEPGTHKLSSFFFSGPITDATYRLLPFQNRMILCPGGKTTTYVSAGIAANISTFQNNRWQNLSRNNVVDGLYDICDVAVNPRDTSMALAAVWGSGILEIVNNVPTTLYNHTNTDGALSAYSSGTYSSLRTASVCFDDKGNAWMTNSLQDQGLAVRYTDGSWSSFNVRSMVGDNEIDHILWDSIRDYKWFYGRANRIYVADGKGKMAFVDPNNGSKMETSSITAMVQDHNGDLWIGTNKGLKLLSNLYHTFDNGGNGEKSPVTSLNIVISSGDIAEYLMAYESITCMAVDGANRKWVGTAAGGLYLISANGLDENYHFTSSNSPLFSDKIICIGVQPQSGEVFVGTDKGLQSFRSTATYATSIPQNEIYAFPNPVHPDYTGAIAIKGFTRDALVHITDAAGHVVFSATAHGGQAIWYGRTLDGKQVASGTYFVFASDESGTMKSVAKVLIIR
ncbi:MAG: hypothetical protein II532_01740 [Bacteroidales bacterium]|nr:hypothetical protein [Bacteroidales bacterium]